MSFLSEPSTGAGQEEVYREDLDQDDGPLTGRERALGARVRKITADPTATTHGDIGALRDAGFDDPRILALTIYSTL